MTGLPVEICVKIFDRLAVNEAIKCRAVCKYWREVLDQFVLVELNLFFYQPLELNQWIFHPSFYRPQKLLCFKFHKVLANEHFRFVFRNLKKLYVFQTGLTANDEQFINSFTNLEHLKMNRLTVGSLRLAKLKTLVVKSLVAEIDCPNLVTLDLDKYSQITFKPNNEPAKLKHLSCFFSYDWTRRLSSLETLSIRKLTHRLDNFLVCFGSLKWIHLRNATAEVITKLVEERARLGRIGLGIYYRGFAIQTRESALEILDHFRWAGVDSNHFGTQTALFYLKQVNSLNQPGSQPAILPLAQAREESIPTFQFFSSISIFDQLKLSQNFLRRFPFLACVQVVQGALTQDELAGLLKALSGFLELQLNSVSLTQSFFDRIPSSFPHLMGLRIDHNLEELENIAFIGQLPRLCRLRIANYQPNENESSLIFVVSNRRKFPEAVSKRLTLTD